jgi:hypothetical protein
MPAGSRSGSNRILFVALLAAPILVAWLPISVLERAPSVCLVRRAGIDCWGCGMTRAVACAARGDLRRAWDYNPRVVAVAPLLLFLWARSLLAARQRIIRHRHRG